MPKGPPSGGLSETAETTMSNSAARHRARPPNHFVGVPRREYLAIKRLMAYAGIEVLISSRRALHETCGSEMCEWRTVKNRTQRAEAALSQYYVCYLSLRWPHMDD